MNDNCVAGSRLAVDKARLRDIDTGLSGDDPVSPGQRGLQVSQAPLPAGPVTVRPDRHPIAPRLPHGLHALPSRPGPGAGVSGTPDEFMARLATACHATLLLDYDGTLAPFHRDPAAARPWPGVGGRLQRIAALPGIRLGIVTGRPAVELLPLLTLLGLPTRPEIWGAHGWERLRPDGRMEVRVLATTARNALREAARRAAGAPDQGARLERKPASVALHWRGLPPATVHELGQWAERAWRPLTGQGGDGDLALLPFDGGMELRAHDCSKALAVQAVIEESPADGLCAYLGDDLTDEDAFTALGALGARGLAMLVRERLRPTAAHAWLQPPLGLLNFLDL